MRLSSSGRCSFPVFIRDGHRARIRDEILDGSGGGKAPGPAGFHSKRGGRTPISHRAPLLLLLELMGSATSEVPANAWKVICYVAAKQVSAEVATGALSTLPIRWRSSQSASRAGPAVPA